MNVLLGIRLAFAGGRESVARIALITGGIVIGVVLLLFSLIVLPAMQNRIDRLAWHRTTGESPQTAPDPALWLPVTDWYDGRMVVRIQVAALGPRPPVPPGMDRLPAPGEIFASPALIELMATVPDDQLRNRFPGQVTGTIEPDGLISPEELVAVVGRTPAELDAISGAYQIRGIEQPGQRQDLDVILGVMVTILTIVLVGPVVIFVAMVTRVGAARREQRFAAIRLAGGTRWQTGVLAATETGVAAVTGTLLGWLAYRLLLPATAGTVTLDGTPVFLEDLQAPVGRTAAVLIGLPLIAIATTLVGMHRVQVTPLGVHRRGRRRPPRAWRIAPIIGGVLGINYIESRPPTDEPDPVVSIVAPLSLLSTLVGLILAGPWVCMWLSRSLARISRRATTLIAARRIAADPYTAFRAVSGVAIATFIATMLGGTAATLDDNAPQYQGTSALDDGVVAIEVRDTPEEALAPLLGLPGVVVARSGPGNRLVVPCTEVARVSELSCPLQSSYDRMPQGFGGGGFAEPGEAATFEIDSLFVPTDGSTAAEERVRTLAATHAPFSLARTEADWDFNEEAEFNGLNTGLWFAMLFVLLVAACSLTVSMVAALMERRRPFALLRASGVRLGELRTIAMLETAAPMVLTMAGGIGVAFVIAWATVDSGEFVWPDAGYFLRILGAMLFATAICAISLPLMNVATRQDAVRYE